MRSFFGKVWHGIVGFALLALIPTENFDGYIVWAQGMPLWWKRTRREHLYAARAQMFVAQVRLADAHLCRSFGNGSER